MVKYPYAWTSSDHYSFFNHSSGNLYSGDLFVHPTTKVILKEESIPQIIQSLNKLLSIDFENLFCQHAGFVPNGKEKLNKKLQNLLTIQGEVLLLNEKGYSEKEIVKKLYPNNYPISYFSFGEWHSKHIVSSILEENKKDFIHIKKG